MFSRGNKAKPPLVPEELDDWITSRSLTTDLKVNQKLLEEIFQGSFDIIFREFATPLKGAPRGLLVFVEGMVDKTWVQEDWLEAVSSPGLEAGKAVADPWRYLKDRLASIAEIREDELLEQLVKGVLAGEVLVLLDGQARGLLLGVQSGEGRSVSESTVEPVVRGPKQAFVESIKVNTVLLRRIIRSPSFKLQSRTLGKYTQTKVVVAYIKGLVEDDLVREVNSRLDRIDLDAVLDSGYLEELIQDAPWSPFPTVAHTERPDKVAANLLEGRVAIIVDGSPQALTVPTVFVELLQASEDYYQRYSMASYVRVSRFIGLNVALLLPSLYIALTTFHQEMLPTRLLISIAAQREGVPLPALLEALLMEMAFEMVREAGSRLPRTIGQTVSIVGALIIGEAAVTAGLVSGLMIVVVGITGIASFSIASYDMANSLRLLRFPLMLLAGFLGLFGVMAGLIALNIHLASLRSFGVPYLDPVAPLGINDLKDTVVRLPWWTMRQRPLSMPLQDFERQPPGRMPRPPQAAGRRNKDRDRR